MNIDHRAGMTLSTADLASMLVERDNVEPGETGADLLAGLILDAAEVAQSAGNPRPLAEHVANARLAFPMFFRERSTTPFAVAAPAAPASLTERVARAGNTDVLDDDVLTAMRNMRGARYR